MTSSLLLLLVVLACPLLMWLTMRGGHGHGGHGSHHAAPTNGHRGDAPSTDDLRRRRAELDREITARDQVEAP